MDVSNVSRGRLAALHELSGSTVHEVNQPVTAQIFETSEAVEAANQVVNNGKRDVAISGGLEVSGEAGRANFSFVGIDGVILEVLGMFGEDLEKASIFVRADIDERLPELRGDRLQLQHVVFNLLRNGIDVMKDVHGRMRRLEISCRANEVEMLVEFRACSGSSGTNINDMNRLFDRFFASRGSVMSLGQFMRRCIIEVHRGRIWAQTNQERGLSICLALPL
jgi:two-component system sensor kinase FixL